MTTILTLDQYAQVGRLFQPLDHLLATTAMLNGSAPATVMVDDPDHPTAALACTGHRFHLAGWPHNAAFNGALGRLFDNSIYPPARAAGAEMFMLYYEPSEWEPVISEILAGKFPLHGQRQYYAFKELKTGWRAWLPEGFSLHRVDRALLDRAELKNLDALKEEMCSERPSVEDFLDRSFGVCAMIGDELAGWCLSEYNSGDRCEIGIETVEPYRQRGLATAMTCALVEEALSRGIARIGWHCWASNVPSARTALKAGFEKVRDYPVCYAWFDKRHE